MINSMVKNKDHLIGLVFYKYFQNDYEIKLFSTHGGIVVVRVAEDCCNDSWIESIDGDITQILDSPVTRFEIVSQSVDTRKIEIKDEDFRLQNDATWSFVKIDTKKGGVTIRFLGTSSGFYCEEASVFFESKF